MRFLAALLFVTLIATIGYYVYQQPSARPQINRLIQSINEVSRSFQDSINQQIGYGGSNLPQQNLTVTVPKREALDWQPLGKMGHDILSKPLQIEVVAAKNVQPDSDEISTVASVLQRYSGREPSILLDKVDVSEQDNYSAGEVADIVKSKRTCYSSSDNTCIFLLFLPGMFESSRALGIAFTSTSTVIMEQQIRKASNPVITKSRIAEGTITHELGHLFGLVNLSYHSPRSHEDSNHPGHSNDANSAMYWAVEDLSLNSILTGGPPISFDSNDSADIADIKAGRL